MMGDRLYDNAVRAVIDDQRSLTVRRYRRNHRGAVTMSAIPRISPKPAGQISHKPLESSNRD